MLSLTPKVIVFLGSAFIFMGIFYPPFTVMSYMVFRPLIQPFAWLQYKLFGLPVAVPLSLFVILLGMVFPFIKKGWDILGEKSALFIMLILLNGLSLFYTESFELSLASFVKILTVWFLYNIAYNGVRSEKDVLNIINTIIAASIIPLLFGFYQGITGRYDIIYDAEVDRISSVFATGNDYGIFLTLVTAATVIRLVLCKGRLARTMLIGVLLMILVSQILSLNRGTWIALTAGFIVAAIKYRKYVNFKWVAGGGLVFLVIFSGKIIERFEELENPTSVHYHGKSTLEARIEYWKALFPVAMDSPVLGHGAGTVTLVAKKALDRKNKPHNDYLLVFVELGVIGVLLYIAFLVRIFLYFFMRKVKRDIWVWNFSLLMLSTYFIIISGVQNIVHSILNFPIFMVLVAIVMRMNRLKIVSELQRRKATQTVPKVGIGPGIGTAGIQ